MKLSIEERVRAPQRVVWQILTDLEGAPGRISGVKALEVLTPGPFGVGTRFRETRVMLGREAVEELEVTHVEAPTSYTVDLDSCGVRYTSTFTLREQADGTLVRFDLQSKSRTMMAKLMKPVELIMAGSMRKLIAKDLADLKRAAEAVIAG